MEKFKKILHFLQKYLGIILIVGFALLFVYSLGMATPTAILKNNDEVSDFYKDIMPYNNGLLIISIIGVLLGILYNVLRNNVRPIYYTSNFVSSIITMFYCLFAGIYCFVAVGVYQNKYFSLVNGENFKEIEQDIYDSIGKHVSRSSTVFVLGYLVATILILLFVVYRTVLFMKNIERFKYEQNKKLGVPNPVTFELPVANYHEAFLRHKKSETDDSVVNMENSSDDLNAVDNSSSSDTEELETSVDDKK